MIERTIPADTTVTPYSTAFKEGEVTRMEVEELDVDTQRRAVIDKLRSCTNLNKGCQRNKNLEKRA